MRTTADGAPCEVKASCTVRNGGKAGNIETVGLPIVIALDPFINKSSLFLLETVVIIGAIILIAFFVRQTPTLGVHIVMNTGTAFIFASKHSSFILKAYDALCEHVDQPPGHDSVIILDFADGTIVTSNDY